MYTRKNISVALLIGTVLFASSSIADYLELKAIEVDIIETGAYELYQPLQYSIAGTLCFILATLLSFTGQNLKLVGLLGIIASAITWVFYSSKLMQFSGYVIFLIFSPYVVLLYFVPILFLITLRFLSIRLIVSRSQPVA